jgi:hypothetical protein
MRHCYLFLRFSCNEKSAKKKTVAGERVTINGITQPSGVRVSEAKADYCEHRIAVNMLSPLSTEAHEVKDYNGLGRSTNKLNCMSNARSCHSEVYKDAYKLVIARGVLKGNTIGGAQLQLQLHGCR